MDERNNTRREKVVNCILDTGAEDLQKISVEAYSCGYLRGKRVGFK